MDCSRTFISEHRQDKSLWLEYIQHIPHHAPIVPETGVGLEGGVGALLLRGDVDGEVAVVEDGIHRVSTWREGGFIDSGPWAEVVDA